MKVKVLKIVLVYLTAGIFPCGSTFYDKLSESALELTKQEVRYDPAYYRISYPNGDVPGDRGVCTDVIVRAYRALGIDLQVEVHEDMRSNYQEYPNNWGLHRPDPNIDHRRVPNLMTFFSRHGMVKPITKDPKDYIPGDIVCWILGGRQTHIGLVVNARSQDESRHLIVHNIGGGQVLADCLFHFKIIGHYTYCKGS